MKKILTVVFLCAMLKAAKAQNNLINQPATGITSGDNFTYNTFTVSHYGLGWYNDPQFGPPMAYFSAYGGLKFFTLGVPRAVLDWSGFLGIGTLAPLGPLHIKMDNNFSIIQRTSTASYAGHYYVTGPDNAIDYNFFTGLRGNSDSYCIYNGNLGTDALTIDRNSSNVGIGTGDTHGYKLAVNGDIHTKKVVVDLINWPDYVFKSNYNLKPLSEVKSYIDLNHHLPDMPSEKEVAEKGLDLGEMNKLLTKKVEELTLYMIELQKQIDQQKKK